MRQEPIGVLFTGTNLEIWENNRKLTPGRFGKSFWFEKLGIINGEQIQGRF